MGPVCTLMVGRLDDWLKVLHDKHNLSVDPGYLEWAGVAVFKKAYKIYRQRGYRLRLLSAAFRNHMHWSEFIGGDVVISPPCAWQRATTRATSKSFDRIDTPVDPRIVDTLLNKFPDFERAYSENGLTPAEFDTFGSTRRTLRQFISAVAEMNSIVRDIILPNPRHGVAGLYLSHICGLLVDTALNPCFSSSSTSFIVSNQPAAHDRQIGRDRAHPLQHLRRHQRRQNLQRMHRRVSSVDSIIVSIAPESSRNVR